MPCSPPVSIVSPCPLSSVRPCRRTLGRHCVDRRRHRVGNTVSGNTEVLAQPDVRLILCRDAARP